MRTTNATSENNHKSATLNRRGIIGGLAPLCLILGFLFLVLVWFKIDEYRLNKLRAPNLTDPEVKHWIRLRLLLHDRSPLEGVDEISPCFGGTGRWCGGLTAEAQARREENMRSQEWARQYDPARPGLGIVYGGYLRPSDMLSKPPPAYSTQS